MRPDLLEQLRDIHAPAAPGWWPPAPGWWFLALLTLLLLVWGGRRLWRRWRRFQPARAAKKLHLGLARQLEAQSLSSEAWLHATNQLLKRLAVHGLGHSDIIPAWGADWLRYLDRRYGQPAFSRGAGRCFGADRFRPQAKVDAQAANALVHRFLVRECRRFWRPMQTAKERRGHA